jgi:FHA domain
MSEKSVLKGIGSALGGLFSRGGSAEPLPTSTQRCEAGHPMAPNWTTCPYCEAIRGSSEKTIVSPAVGEGPSMSPPLRETSRPNSPSLPKTRASSQMPEGSTGRRTRADNAPDAAAMPMHAAPAPPPSAPGGRRATMVIQPSDDGGRVAAVPTEGRRIRGVVFTFSWSPLGQLFTVREGRNYAGSGTVSGEANRPVDIFIADDNMLSGAHFLILCQGDKDWIRDVDSTNGTYVDGVQIDANGMQLEDGAEIKAGATLFKFQRVRPPGTAASPRPAVMDEPEPDAPLDRPRARDDDII